MDILFVGNSYTLYNDVPKQVREHLERLGTNVAVEVCAEGGANLTRHWEELGTREAVERREMDVLVLQDQSTRPLHNRKEFLRDVERFVEATGNDTRVLLYQTWPRQDGHSVYRAGWSTGSPAGMTKAVAEAYQVAQTLASARGRQAQVATVGETWHGLLQWDETLALYDADGHHASPLGSAVAAWVIGKALSGLPPSLPPDDRFPGLDAAGSSRLLQRLKGS